jgi:hypothetical protein
MLAKLGVGALLGIGISLGMLLIGPFLAGALLVAAALLLYRASPVVTSGLLVAAGATTLFVYLPSLLFGCGGAEMYDSNGVLVSCSGPPSPFFVAAAALGALTVLIGAGLLVASVRRRSGSIGP